MIIKTTKRSSAASSSLHTSTPGCFSGLKKFLASLARVFKRKRRNTRPKEVLLPVDHLFTPPPSQNTPVDHLLTPPPFPNTPVDSPPFAPSQNILVDSPTLAPSQNISVDLPTLAPPQDTLALPCPSPAPSQPPCVVETTPSTEDTSDWHLVCNKKCKGLRNKPSLEAHQSKAVEGSTSPAGTKCAKSSGRRKTFVPYQDSRGKVRQSWAQDTVAVVMQVAPHMRCHVIGQRGETILKLRQDYPGVKVTVPPPRDTQTPTITIRGPPAQVTAVQGCITACLNAAHRKRHLPRSVPSGVAR